MPNLQWDLENCIAGIYRKSGYIHGITNVEAKSLESFVGVQKETQLLCTNTESFLQQNLGVNVLLWGARGSGKSSLVKALLLRYAPEGLRVLQVDKEDLEILPEVFDILREKPYWFIIFCDDLSFEQNENYKGLKSVLEGSLETLPKNIRIYATSNRRHLLPEFHDENEIFGYEGNEDKIALSDRFPLCIGFYTQGSREYLEVLKGYFLENNVQLPQEWERICQKAMQYATQKGSRNPRTAAHFYALYKSNLWELL
ncbi:ATP-binding protein [Helicobacter turcicus]|uniref:ATP-binding protein n=1 Tax=Helicobacter turcicus TaxID=2867412 RepID=A0ABS7JLB9_9HELI|nr:ATP-binding protein [Helicobacter turcicus]MBX7490179.1 ATP-binding protein [Helicobacter turcicus]MBX7545242.1 ATP-binding protein [Helicobacter turcicus]